MLHEPYFEPKGLTKEEETPNITIKDKKGNVMMDMHALLIAGLLLCPASVEIKVRLFYDLL